MLNPKKIVVAAGILGSVALTGFGAAQASADDGSGSGTCKRDARGSIHCESRSEHRYTSDNGTQVTVVQESVSCSSHEINRSYRNGEVVTTPSNTVNNCSATGAQVGQ